VNPARTVLLIAAVLVFLCGSVLVLVWGSWEIVTPFYSTTVLLLGIASLVEGRDRAASWVLVVVGLLVTIFALIRLFLTNS
jgi:TRAP-type C4-dicarboxylate transport system permease small subunit